jgi:hypothetical protein
MIDNQDCREAAELNDTWNYLKCAMLFKSTERDFKEMSDSIRLHVLPLSPNPSAPGTAAR